MTSRGEKEVDDEVYDELRRRRQQMTVSLLQVSNNLLFLSFSTKMFETYKFVDRA
jgi:hypothetical protein